VSTPAARMRVGDAERAAAADRLARHFSHGRLDQDELDHRLDRVMRATTAGDLTEVFADLPAGEPVPTAVTAGQTRPAVAGRAQPARGRRRRGQAVIVAALCIIAAISVAHALAHSIVLLAVVGLIAVFWLRNRRVRDRGSPPRTP
jgi:Flp pilus assembly protein TadB